MCKMKVVIRREMLGAREQCWSLFNGRDIQELTAKQIKDIIRGGKEKVCGLRIGRSGELEADEEGFFTKNIMEHRHCGNFKPMYEDENMVNMMYTVVGSHDKDGVTVYEAISNRFEQAELTADEVVAYIRIGVVASGAKLENGKIVLADTVYKMPEKVEAEPKHEAPKQPEIKETENKTLEAKTVQESKKEPDKKIPEEKAVPLKK